MIDILLGFMALVVVLRWIVFGYVITKHGEPKTDSYNAVLHLFGTLIWCWMLYTIYTL